MQKKRDDSARRRAAFKCNATDEQREAQRVYERNKKKHQLANRAATSTSSEDERISGQNKPCRRIH